MHRFAAAVIGIVLLGILIEGTANAAGPFRRLFRGRPSAEHQVPAPVGPPAYQGYQQYRYQPYDPPWNQPDLYPKWYGGFHSRSLTTLGMPSGDIGLRGLPW